MKNLLLLLGALCACIVVKAQCGSSNYTDPQFTINVQNPACPQVGEITVTSASGGTLPYTYTLLPNHITNSTGTFSNLTPGTYYVQMQDACGTIRSRQATISPYSFTSAVSMTSLGCRKFQFDLTSTATSTNLQYGFWMRGSTDTTWTTSPQILTTVDAPAVLDFIVKDECGNVATVDQYIPKESGGYIKKLNERIKCNGQEIYPEYYGFDSGSTVCLYKSPQNTLVECKTVPSANYHGGAATNFLNLPFGQDYYVIVQNACYRDSAFFKDKTSAGGSELNPFAWHCTTFDLHSDGNNSGITCLYRKEDNSLVECKPDSDTAINPNTGLPWPYGGAEFYNLPYGSYYTYIYDPCSDSLLKIDTTVTYPYRSHADGFGTCMVGQSVVAAFYAPEAPLPRTTRVYWPNDSLVGTYNTTGWDWQHRYPTYPGTGTIKVITQDGCGKTDTAYIVQPVVLKPVRRKEVIGGCPGIYGPSGGGDIVLHGNGDTYAINGSLGRVKIINKDGQPVSISQNYTQFNSSTNEQDYYFTNLSSGTYVVESSLGCTDYKVYDTVTINPYVYPVQEQTNVVQCGSNPITFKDTVTGGVSPLTFEILQTIPNIPSLLTGPQEANTFVITPGLRLDTIKIRVIDFCGNSSIEQFPIDRLATCETLLVGEGQNPGSKADGHIHVFPNPFTKEFFVKFAKRKKSSYRINVTNALGISIYTKTVENVDTQTIRIDLPDNKGVYFVQIDDLKTNNTYRYKQVSL